MCIASKLQYKHTAKLRYSKTLSWTTFFRVCKEISLKGKYELNIKVKRCARTVLAGAKGGNMIIS